MLSGLFYPLIILYFMVISSHKLGPLIRGKKKRKKGSLFLLMEVSLSHWIIFSKKKRISTSNAMHLQKSFIISLKIYLILYLFFGTCFINIGPMLYNLKGNSCTSLPQHERVPNTQRLA